MKKCRIIALLSQTHYDKLRSNPLKGCFGNDIVDITPAFRHKCHGIVIPWVNSKEEALCAVRAFKNPQAVPGVGPRRVPQCRLNMKEYLHEASDEVLIVVQVEMRQAVGSIDEILPVECIDAFLSTRTTSQHHLGTSID